MNPDPLLDDSAQQPLHPQQQERLTHEQQIKEIERALQAMKDNGTADQPAYADLLRIWSEKTGHAAQPAPLKALPQEMGLNPRNLQNSTFGEELVPGHPNPGSVNMTPQQIMQLKNQMASYKHLSKNAPVPAAMQVGSENPVKQEEAPLVAEAEKKEAQDQKVTEAVPKKDEAQTQPGSTATSGSKAIQGRRFLVPSKMPPAINPQEAMKAREDNIKNRIQYRIAELENLSVSLPNEQKLKALIELKALRLLEYQKKVREEVATGMKKVTTLETSISQTAYKKGKKQSFKESRVAENLEKQQQKDKEQREKQVKAQRREFLDSVLTQRANFNLHHSKSAKATSKLGKLVAAWHANTEKEEAKKQERKAKERLKALKADDEDAYRKLIDTEKDTRITHLLQQTDSYLGELGSMVMEQKRDTEAGIAADDEDGHQSKDFYQIAHSVNEKVTKQSSLLVGGKLKEYQIRGLEWMISLYNNNLNGILADEMGLGKTIQTISLITYLIEHKKQVGPHLVIVPLSTLTNWQLEFEKWAPSVVKIVYLGSPQARKVLQNQLRTGQFNVLLTTYDFVMRDKAALSKIRFNYMIIDEGHRMKNAHCKLTQVLSQFYSSKHRLLLTGTPLQNNLPELWALLNFLLPVIFKSVKSFEEWFNAPFANTGEQLELNEEETLLVIRRLHKVLRPFMLRRLKKDVESELPDKVEKILKCQMSSLQRKLYKQIKHQGAFLTENSDQAKQPTVMGLSNIVVHLRKLCNHPYVFREVEDQMNKDLNININLVRAAGKFELLDRILPKFKASGHKVLMFFQMTEVMNIFEDYCRWREYSYLRLDGNTKADDRRVAMKDWNDPAGEKFVFLLSTRAGGLGLNLQTADTVIIFDSDWNPHQDLQAQDRAHRIGQTKEVRVYRLITVESVEEHILERAQYKLNVDSKVIQAGKFDQKSTAEERDMLLKALLEEDNQEHEEDDIFDDEELNQVLARDDKELELFRKIDSEIEKSRLKEWREMGKKGTPTRLMETSELPQIYLKTEEEIAESRVEKDVEGKRQQKRIHEYLDEELSEAQWLKLVDEGKDVGEYIKKKRERKERRLQKAREGAPPEDESSEEEVEEEPEDEPPRKKRKGETKGKTKEKEPAKEKDSAPGSPTPVVPLDFKTASLEVLDAVINSRDKFGRQRAELFLELPSQEDYPTYYEIIKIPIAIDMIQKRIEEDHYKGVQKEFVDDLELMFKNARTYNQQGSQIYDDANFLQKLVNNTIKQQTTKSKATPRKPVVEEKTSRGRSKSKLGIEEEDEDAKPEEEDDDDDEEAERPKRGVKKASKGKKGKGSRGGSKAPEVELGEGMEE